MVYCVLVDIMNGQCWMNRQLYARNAVRQDRVRLFRGINDYCSEFPILTTERQLYAFGTVF